MEKKTSHPWDDFLDARVKAILWMKNEQGADDRKIALILSMDEQQVYLIRTHIDREELYRKSTPIPQYTPTFEEVSKQMRINVDIFKQEITDHVDKEIARLKNASI
jgi:hypothetical protein